METDSVIHGFIYLSCFESLADLVILPSMSSYTSLLKMANRTGTRVDQILHLLLSDTDNNPILDVLLSHV